MCSIPQMGFEPPGPWNQITLAAYPKLLDLALRFEDDAQAPAPPTARVAVLAPDDHRFLDHVADYPQIGGLALRVVTVVHEQFRQMPDPAADAPEAELEFVISRVQKLLVPIAAEPVIDRLAHEQGLVADVIHPVKEDLVIVTGR